MKKLLVATGNPGKVREISAALKGVQYELIFLKDLDLDVGGFCEDGETFAQNAARKACFFRKKTGFLTLGEDSGILVDALDGELGVFTRRWGRGEDATDQQWLDYFMKRMNGESRRTARFVCSACLFDGSVERFFEGVTEGRISETVMAPISPGIPLSSVFIPEGCDRVYAALSAQEKNRVSHRGKAVKDLRDYLESLA